ncbi:site-specific DNA-methyltransferase [Aeromonas caviae]
MTNKNNPKYQSLVAKLREIFQIDRPELDFGIYRILNARAGEVNDYLDNRLAAKVQAALNSGSDTQRAQLTRELKEKEAQYQADGINPDTVPKVLELRQKLAQLGAGANEHENAVFSYLLAFFSRYYEQGDFISQRRYKGDTYAIPYAGEEVMLHWANKDQYYTKSGENFSNYSFKLPEENGEPGRTVHFRLTAADTAKDNRKDNDKERRFALIEKKIVTRVDEEGNDVDEEILPVEEVDGVSGRELIIRFEYAVQPKGTKQEALISKATSTVLADTVVKTHWLALGSRAPTEKNPQRTLLEKHLTHYTTKNAADYFIHKDLGGFLRRELDFYIKNEVMNLDDVQDAGAFADIEKSLRMIQCLRAIALDLIVFLAQLENFQKKLWLKKKFVVSSHYCITLDRVPETLYPEIVENDRQWEQWRLLGVWDGDAPGTIEDLRAAPYRMVDTSLFNVTFRADLLKAISDLDASLDGVLVNGENFQSLGLLHERYQNQVSCVYLDPPYNTGKDGFCYKDGYLHSSWVAMLWDRLKLAPQMLSNQGAVFVSIDENEFHTLRFLGDSIFGRRNLLSEFTWQTEGNYDNQAKVKVGHEYIACYVANEPDFPSPPVIDPSVPETSKLFKTEIRNTIVKNGPKNPVSEVIVPVGFPADFEEGVINFSDISFPRYSEDIIVEKFKVKNEVVALSGWSSKALYESFIDSGLTHVKDSKGQTTKFVITRTGAIEAIKVRADNQSYVTSIIKGVGTVQSTSAMLEAMGTPYPFYPKPIKLVSYLASMAGGQRAVVMDYFAGSGTTGHAVIDLNRADKGARKFILVEQGEYFDTIIKPRIQKVVYSAGWRDGKPTAPETGISHCFKVLKLESYEDTLNNLQLRKPTGTDDLFNMLSQEVKDDYLLNYMLDVESRGSLLSVEDFKKPFDYRLNVAVDSAGAFEPRKIDLVETFNYLIGLRVKHIDAQQERGFVTVTGTLPSGETCLVLWRDCDVLDYDGINQLCDKLAINPADNEFDLVYINGDHNIPTRLTQTGEDGGATQSFKLRQIEPEFLARMFSVEDL